MSTRKQSVHGLQQPLISIELRRLMRARFLRQRDIAIALDIHEITVSRWMRGVFGPKPGMLRRLAAYLDVEPGSLLDEQPEELAA